MIEGGTAASDQKALGAFYTERAIANLVARLAIQNSRQRVLDPSVGGGVFLEAARDRIIALGGRVPLRGVYGVDIDPTVKAARDGISGLMRGHFLVQDFLRLRPDCFGGLFDVVLGNPPFVRHHLMAAQTIESAQSALDRGRRVPRTADAWLYFFFHSLKFIRQGGGLAMVLPGALLNADYAAVARRSLSEEFESVRLFLVRKRLFPDALESPVIVLAEGFGARPKGVRLCVVDSVEQIVGLGEGAGVRVDLSERTGPWRLALLPQAARRSFVAVTQLAAVAQLGAIAEVRIGVVTGANRFFVLSEEERSFHGLPRRLFVPTISSSKQFRGLEYTKSSHHIHERDGARVLLMNTQGRSSSSVEAYLSSSLGTAARRAYKCRHRAVWHRLGDLSVPGAFLSYVVDRLPRLVLNPAAALSLNSVHRVFWRRRTTRQEALLRAVGIVSSLGGLSAEVYGRSVGGGALKLEPSDAASLWVPSQLGPRSFNAEPVSKALRVGDWERARDLADQIVRMQLGISVSDFAELRNGHDALLEIRFSVAARATPRALKSNL